MDMLSSIWSMTINVVIVMIMVPLGIVTIVNMVSAVALTGAVIRKSKKCNDIKGLE